MIERDIEVAWEKYWEGVAAEKNYLTSHMLNLIKGNHKRAFRAGFIAGNLKVGSKTKGTTNENRDQC